MNGILVSVSAQTLMVTTFTCAAFMWCLNSNVCVHLHYFRVLHHGFQFLIWYLPGFIQLASIFIESLGSCFWCQTLPNWNKHRVFVCVTGVNLGSQFVPSMQQAGTRDGGGAYEVVSVSLLNGDPWNPMKTADSEVSFLLFPSWLFSDSSLKFTGLHSYPFIQVLSLMTLIPTLSFLTKWNLHY